MVYRKLDENPCKVCNTGERSAYCHSTCERYNKWKKEWEEWKAGYLKEKYKQGDFKAYMVNATKNMTRKKRNPKFRKG